MAPRYSIAYLERDKSHARVVIRRRGGGTSFTKRLLRRGESASLRDGDRFGLHACEEARGSWLWSSTSQSTSTSKAWAAAAAAASTKRSARTTARELLSGEMRNRPVGADENNDDDSDDGDDDNDDDDMKQIHFRGGNGGESGGESTGSRGGGGGGGTSSPP